jgi:tetratricopeptide (TPR) repeat protein
MAELPIPFVAYNGPDPYIFVSYAHRNKAVVYDYLRALRDAGFRIWYDEGITPKEEWSEEIGRAIQNSAGFLAFVSPEAVESEYVRMEINFAVRLKKSPLAVHLCKTVLSVGLEWQLGHRQAILVYQFPWEYVYEKLIKALPPEARTQPPAPAPNPSPPPGGVPTAGKTEAEGRRPEEPPNRYEKIEEEKRRAIELDLNNAKYHDSLALTLYRMGRYEEAEREIRRTVEFDPNNATYRTGRALTLLNMGRY